MVTREPQVQLLQSHTMNKNTIKTGIILFILVLAISGILIHHWRSEQKTISINADRYTLLKADEEIGNRIATEITEHKKIQDINKTLSGTYQEKKRIKTMEELHKEVICIASPMYMKEDYREIDKCIAAVSYKNTEDGYVIYGAGIYVIDERTIGIRDVDSKDIWIGEKKKGKIDVSLLRSMTDQS